MIMDKLCEFADAATGVAAAAGTVLLPNQIDLSVVRDIGNGEPVYLNIVCDQAIITWGTAGTIQFRLVSDDTASIHATTCSVHLITKAFVTDDIALAECLTGKVIFSAPIPAEGVEAYERYLGVQAIIATTTTTEGAVSAFLSRSPMGVKMYPDALPVT